MWKLRQSNWRRRTIHAKKHPSLLKVTLPEARHQAARIIHQGGVIAFPTDTLYGLGADIWNPQAVERVFLLKGREFGKPLPVLIGTLEQLPQLVRAIPPRAERLLQAFWPGPLTLLFPARPEIHPLLLGDAGKIGIRLPAYPWVQDLIQRAGVPLTGTSANPAGKPPALDALQVLDYFGDRLDLILDGGRAEQTVGSTVVDVSVDPPLFIREGILRREEILQYL